MSGAANCPETPRQKMIGMMYLFLTAMLALNVSREVLESFTLVNQSLTNTTENFIKKNEKVYINFEQADIENHAKVGEWREKALNVKEKADSVFEFIQDLKLEIVRKGDGDDAEAIEGRKINTEKINAKDDLNKAAEIMVGSTGIGKGRDLKIMINQYREYLVSLVSAKDSTIIAAVKQGLDTSDPKPKPGESEHQSWETSHFEHLPLVAVITIMSKLQSDIRNAEADVVNYLYSQIDASSFKFNKLCGTIIPNSNYIFKGGVYEAEIFLAAFDTTRQPVIFVGNYDSTETGYKMIGDYDSIPIVNSKGVYKVTTQKEGYQKWGGLIQYIVPGGGVQNYPFKGEFKVASPNLVVSPTKMNVFYYNIDNPVDISVSGVASDKIHPAASNATIKRARKGGYIVRPTKTGGIVKVRVTADVNGVRKPMGYKNFRIRTVPKPVAKVMGKSQGTIRKNMLLGAPGVNAELEDFVFDLRFFVKKFTVTATISGYSNSIPQNGNKFSSKQKRFIKTLRSGDNLIIEDIKAAGPDGRMRELQPLVFKIK